MKTNKKILHDDLEKCYAIGMFDAYDVPSFLIGTEKEGPILRYDLTGRLLEEVTPGPGGVMTICQVPGRKDQFLATEKFFSPNCGADEAKIVSYTREGAVWKRRVVAELPYVHRFGFVQGQDGTWYLIAAAIKSSCEYKEDWRDPGKIYVAPIEQTFEHYDLDTPLKLEVLRDNQLKNHGFWMAPDHSYCVIATNDGVFKFTPPVALGESWTEEVLLDQPTSDIVLADFDGDGQLELMCLSPFHGDTLTVYHMTDEGYKLCFEDKDKHAFLHALCAVKIFGKEVAFIGNRRDKQEVMCLSYQDGTYHVDVIDSEVGPANCWCYELDGTPYLIACNRETNELALYEIESI